MYFTTTLAKGDVFCNREREQKMLQYNLYNHVPTLLMSPRRYGKTSLGIKTLKETGLLYAHIDIFMATSEQEIVHFVKQHIGNMLTSLETMPSKIKRLVTDFFSEMNIKVVLETMGVKVEVDRQNDRYEPAIALRDILWKLEDLLKKWNKQAVLFFDEFQILGELSTSHAMEAGIREVIQSTEYLKFVFAGSNRHMMESIFEDKKRPFYNSCSKIILPRIKPEDYTPHIQKAAQARWGKKMTDEAINCILTVTECHPYYVNALCSLLWFRDSLPDEEAVAACWSQYVIDNKSYIEQELTLLATNQKRVLIFINEERYVTQPYHSKYSQRWGMSSASINRAIKALEKIDYVYRTQEGYYRVLNPLMASVLKKERPQ